MNWDYRYSWLRDLTFTLGALINAGYLDEALRWRDWLLRAIAGSPEKMRTMYRVDGGRDLHERTIEGLSGYRYARPVRVGTRPPRNFNWISGARSSTCFGPPTELASRPPDTPRLCA